MSCVYEMIEDAFYFVSSAPPGEHVAVLNRRSGEIYFASDLVGHYDIPDDVDHSDDYIEIPHRSQLVLAEPLVLEFARLRFPQHSERLRAILAGPGGHSRYKRFLAEENLLEEWYVFEMACIREALMEWGKQRGICLEPRRKG